MNISQLLLSAEVKETLDRKVEMSQVLLSTEVKETLNRKVEMSQVLLSVDVVGEPIYNNNSLNIFLGQTPITKIYLGNININKCLI